MAGIQGQYGTYDEATGGEVVNPNRPDLSGYPGPQQGQDVLEWYQTLLGQGLTWDEAGAVVARQPSETQEDLFTAIDQSGANADNLQQAVQRERQEAFKRGEILPGVDAAGGGTGLERDQIQSILTGQAMGEAEEIQGQQPGLDAYTYDPQLDDGPGYSLLDELEAEGAFLDEDVEAFDPKLATQADFNRREDGRNAQLETIGEYDEIIDQEGLTDIDRARIERMRQDTARRGRAQEGAILADAAEQGRAGGNMSFLLRSQAQQAATNERALGDMDTAAMGLARKDDAIRSKGFVGRDVQSSDDMISKFNTEQSQGVINDNIDRLNKAGFAAWDQEQINKGENVDVKQGAIGAEYDNDTARSDRNTNRVNDAEIANDRGTQNHYSDMWSSFGNKFGVTKSGPAFENGGGTPGTPGSSGLAEAGQGAIGGAAAGSTLGPVGTVAGAATGGFLGYLGGRQKRQRGTTSW